MTEQSQNTVFHSSSFLQGQNAEYVEQLHARYANDPASVDASWQAFFRGLNDADSDVRHSARGPSWARADWPTSPNDELTAALDGQWGPEPSRTVGDKVRAKAAEVGVAVTDAQVRRAVTDSLRALMLIRAYRIRGHLEADLDPLGLEEMLPHPELRTETYGFTEADLDRPIFIDNVLGLETASLRQILAILKRTYCGTFALQFMHISDPEQSAWLKERIEGYGKEISFTQIGRRAILNKLVEAEGFEKFLQVKYTGTKRFGLDGGESLIPAMEQIIKRGGALGVEEIVIGMPHRGRLSVLANVMEKPYRAIFNEFQGGSFKPEEVEGSGDVKYHLGASSDREFDGNTVHLSLTANPSHLEAVDPVVLGKVRAKQAQRGDLERIKVLPILLHGDAAFAGQGVVAECFGLSGLRGHRTGGTIHIVVNNQIGFTTAPMHSRSSPYPTDIALMVEAPIFHVNGDDPEAVVHAARVAIEFRQRFHKDVVIDMFCYRRFGHNEGDEPMFTQPLMYKAIKSHKTTLQLYTERLIADGLIPEGEIEDMKAAFQAHLNAEFEAGREFRPNKADWLDGRWSGMTKRDGRYQRGKTAVDMSRLKRVGEALTRLPEAFQPHKTVQRMLEAKRQMIETGEGLDWATAEALAFGTLLTEGFPVRLSGQDSARGTFSQRHSGIIDQETEERYLPLNHIEAGQASFEVVELDALRVRGARLRVRLFAGRAERADALGGAVRRLRQRRPDPDRPVHLVGRGEVAQDVGPRHAAAARLRGPGPRALLRASRALPADVRGRQHDRGELHDPGQLLPHPAPADPPQLPQALDPDDAEVAAPPQARGLQAQGSREGLELPPRALGRRRHAPGIRHLLGQARVRRQDQARRALLGQGLLRPPGGARRPRDR